MDLDNLPIIRAGKKVFHLYTMKNGASICCHGKPKKTDLIQLHNTFGINYVLTILYPKEKPETIHTYCSNISPDIYWDNLELYGANISYFLQKKTIELIINHIISLLKYLNTHQNTKIYLHCAAGLHRTGTILYTILRCCGESKETVMDVIKAIRYETFRDMGQKRIDYAEDYLVTPILNKMAESSSESAIKADENAEKADESEEKTDVIIEKADGNAEKTNANTERTNESEEKKDVIIEKTDESANKADVIIEKVDEGSVEKLGENAEREDESTNKTDENAEKLGKNTESTEKTNENI